MNVRVQGCDVKWYHHLVIFNRTISDTVGKPGRILSVVIFIFNIKKNVNYVFVNIVLRA